MTIIEIENSLNTLISNFNKETFIFDLATPIEPIELNFIGIRFHLVDSLTLEVTMDKLKIEDLVLAFPQNKL